MQRSARVSFAVVMPLLLTAWIASVAASNLPAIACATTRPPAATCTWQAGGSCSWEEGGTPVTCAPATGAQVRLRPAGTYRGGYFNASAANGVAFDKATRRLFVANSRTQSIDVISLSGGVINPDRPSRLTKQFSINVAALLPVIPVNAGVVQAIGAATPTSIVVHNGLLAVVLQHGQEPTRRGKVAFYRAAGGPSDPPLKVIDVGFMPAEATFTPEWPTLAGRQRRRAHTRLSHRPPRLGQHHRSDRWRSQCTSDTGRLLGMESEKGGSGKAGCSHHRAEPGHGRSARHRFRGSGFRADRHRGPCGLQGGLGHPGRKQCRGGPEHPAGQIHRHPAAGLQGSFPSRGRSRSDRQRRRPCHRRLSQGRQHRAVAPARAVHAATSGAGTRPRQRRFSSIPTRGFAGTSRRSATRSGSTIRASRSIRPRSRPK